MSDILPSPKYIFYIAKVYSIPIFIPLVAYLENNNRQYRFYVADKVLKNFPDSWKKDLVLQSLEQARAFQADFVLVSGNFVDFRIPGVKVQLFHGLGVEKDVHYKIRHFFDIYLTSGPFVTKRFKKLQDEHKYFIVRETGWPKIDYILNFDSTDIRKRLDLPANKKVVLYAPTFSTKHQSASDLLDIIPGIIKQDELWLCKFHELMDKEKIKEYENIAGNSIKVLGNVEITPYLHAADIMISDTSSVVYEFMVLDKPVITFNAKGNPEKACNITQPEELRKALDFCLANPKEIIGKQQKFLNEVNPELSGNISNKVFEILDDLDLTQTFSDKKKPLNLVRKLQIIYHSRFRKGYLR
jgi:CDP-ribitol ribitolphosphotransferase / teichoic acid ribitol-phosphate polymerase